MDSMKKDSSRHRYVTVFTILCTVLIVPASGQEGSVYLDLGKARAVYEMAKKTMDSDKILFDKQVLSAEEYNKTRRALLDAEVDYQKALLVILGQSTHILVERAVKYQTPTGERRVKLTLGSTGFGGKEILGSVDPDLMALEILSGAVYDVFVSLVNLADGAIISRPYELRIQKLAPEVSIDVDFGLLKDVDSLQVSLSYSGRIENKAIMLEQAVLENRIDMRTSQFSQEADLGTEARYELSLDRL